MWNNNNPIILMNEFIEFHHKVCQTDNFLYLIDEFQVGFYKINCIIYYNAHSHCHVDGIKNVLFASNTFLLMAIIYDNFLLP